MLAIWTYKRKLTEKIFDRCSIKDLREISVSTRDKFINIPDGYTIREAIDNVDEIVRVIEIIKKYEHNQCHINIYM